MSNILFNAGKQDTITKLKTSKSSGSVKLEPGEEVNIVIRPELKFYNEADEELRAQFEGIAFENVNSITLSGNSYGHDACSWIAAEVLAHCNNLHIVDFRDIFTQRKREELPGSLKVLIDAISDKPITHLDLSENAFGPDGVASFMDFLSSCSTLTTLKLNNNGLSGKAGEMLAEAITKNDNQRLVEFRAIRNRLEDDGFAALAEVFEKQKSIEVLHLSGNGTKRGFKPLLASLLHCTESLRELIINDGKSINRATEELGQVITQCSNLEVLDISDLGMKRKYAGPIADALIQVLENDSKLRHLHWDSDLIRSFTTAKSFMDRLAEISNDRLETVSMTNVFQKQENRHMIGAAFQYKKVKVTLFKKDYSDEESADRDNSEEISEEDVEDSHSSQNPDEE